MRKQVILVDDSKTVLASCKMAFEDMIDDGEIEVLTYINPIKMLNDIRARKISYDLVIIDVNMPYINGLDLARELKSNSIVKDKPIIMMTVENSDKMKVEAKEIGVIEWKVKPCSDEALIKSVRNILEL